MSECVKCGKHVAEDSRFCPSCGATVVQGELTVTSPPRDPDPDLAQRPRAAHASVHGRFEPGTKLGTRYRIVGLLGRGGMGEVYRADDLELGQSVALKFLPERVAADPVSLDRFRGEVRNARKIAHANVCRMYDIGEIDGHVFLSMEYIDGEDLAHVLARMGRPSEEKALEIARQLCLGLAAAHENGLLHRDLKPANIMIDGRGRVRITDFGLAGLAEELDAKRERAGTPAYMAPEQLEDGKVSVRSDIYALGLVLHELFTGRRAFETNDATELKRLRSAGSMTIPSSGTHPVDSAVQRVIERCLALDPQQRPQSVYVVLGALPGSDPLAAALAAGELPSPDLVANARNADGLRPPIAIGLLVGMLAFMAIIYFVYAGTTVTPKRSPAVLSVVAEQVMEELGYVDLPSNSVSGYDVNSHLSDSLNSSPRPADELAELDWPPRFRYWRRWTAGAFIPVGFHNPETFNFDGLTTNPNHTATVALDSTGRLLGLLVTHSRSETTSAAGEDTDWSPVFRRANLDESAATQIPLIKKPTVYCDEVVVWRLKRVASGGDHFTFQMGAVAGRPNYFEFLELDKTMARKYIEDGVLTTMARPSSLVTAIRILMVILAWRNLRASRGDQRSAIRSAMFVGALYALMHMLSRLLQNETVQEPSDAGHVLLHAAHVWIAYMAIEPYVRRVWPRMLIGVVRLLSGRLSDPAVGREVLIGVVTGCGLVAILAMTSSPGWLSQSGDTGYLQSLDELDSWHSPVQFLCEKFHRAAWTVMDAFQLAGLLIAIRILARHTLAAIGVGIAVIGLTAYVWFVNSVGESWLSALVYASCFGVTMVLLYTRVGILAGMVAFFVLVPYRPTVTELDTWFTPYGMAELAIVLALAAYGFWVSLAGQTLFKDMLLTEKPARA